MAGTITVFGGTGFIGRYLVGALLQSGAAVRLAARHPGQVKKAAEPANAPEIVQGDILDDVSVGAAITGADAVVNLVGILTETATQTYRAIHIEGARRVGLAAQRLGVTSLIHISALGASLTSPAISDQTKAQGERAVREVFPRATIVRPSLTYGEDDHFFSRFAAIIRSSPVLPLIGGGTTRFQPVFVGDVTAGLLELLSAAAMERADLLRIHRDHFLPYVKANPDLIVGMLTLVCDRLRWTSSTIEDTAFLSFPARIAVVIPGGPSSRTRRARQHRLNIAARSGKHGRRQPGDGQ